MRLAKVISGDVEGAGPVYCVVAIEYQTTRCTACRELFLVGGPGLFRVDDRGRESLIHPECRPQ